MAESEEIKARIAPAMLAITALFNEKKIAFCFIGGVSVNEYGHDYFTSDIDVVLLVDDRPKFNELIGTYFKPAFPGAEKNFIFSEYAIRFEIIYSGEISGDGIHGLPYAPPREISELRHGLPFLTLRNLIAYKIATGLYARGRLKDFAAVQELIKVNQLPRDYAGEMRADVREKYLEIWDGTY